jgi:hypothetical protein
LVIGDDDEADFWDKLEFDWQVYFLTSYGLLQSLEQLHSTRYLEPHVKIRKSAENLHLILTDYKFNRPDIFHSNLRVTPESFDALLSAISDHDVFHSNCTSEQAPVKIQLAVALYRFSHFGNAAGLFKVGFWAGVG